MEFDNKDVAAKYEPVFDKDKQVYVQGIGQVYSGPLSGINLEAADKMHKDGDNQLRLKDEKKTKEVATIDKIGGNTHNS